MIVYQDQVLQIANRLAGYSLGEADLLRRAMGKKKPEEMEKQRERFVSGCVERGIDRKQADAVFQLMAEFAGYGFAKSHSAAYALITYQTAYLKANHPARVPGGPAHHRGRQPRQALALHRARAASSGSRCWRPT